MGEMMRDQMVGKLPDETVFKRRRRCWCGIKKRCRTL